MTVRNTTFIHGILWKIKIRHVQDKLKNFIKHSQNAIKYDRHERKATESAVDEMINKKKKFGLFVE